MISKYTAAFLAYLFPCNQNIDEYRLTINSAFNADFNNFIDVLIKENVLFINQSSVMINPDYIRPVSDEFKTLATYTQNYCLEKLLGTVKNIYNSSIYCKLINFYCDTLFKCDDSLNKSNLEVLEQIILKIVRDDSINIQKFENIVRMFGANDLCDTIKKKLINALYKVNQNRLVVYLYEKIKDKSKIDVETLMQVSSAYFMLSDITSAEGILSTAEKRFDDPSVQQAIQIVKLINSFETGDSTYNIENKFYDLVNDVSSLPNCISLLLKISASVLPHEKAIDFISHRKLSDRTIQIYNNLGALYLAEGQKRYIQNTKDTEYLVKARKYFDFTKMLVDESNEYTPYFDLNLLSMKFNIEYRKHSSRKTYNSIYKRFRKMEYQSDSIYFKSIVLCNCLALEKITSNDTDAIEKYRVKLLRIEEKTSDPKIKTKIKEFNDFVNDRIQFLPVWVITETHY